jgi:hypothetical protein
MATDIVCYRPKDREVLVIRVNRNGENWSWLTAINLHRAGATVVGFPEGQNEKFVANYVYEMTGNGLIYRLFDDGLGSGAECLEFMVDPDSRRKPADLFLELPKLLRSAGFDDEQGLAIFERYLRSQYLLEMPAVSLISSEVAATASENTAAPIAERRNDPFTVAYAFWQSLRLSLKKTGRWLAAGSIAGAVAGVIVILLNATAGIPWFGPLVLSETGQIIGKVVSWLLFLGVFGAICECLGGVAEFIMLIGGIFLLCLLIGLGLTVVKIIAPFVTGCFFGLLIGAITAGIAGFLVQFLVSNVPIVSSPEDSPSTRT